VRHDNSGFYHDPERTPFDVLSPEGVEYIRDNLEETYQKMKSPAPCLVRARAQLQEAEKRRPRPMDAEEKVSWLAAHHANLTRQDIAAIVDVSERLVHRYISRREYQVAQAKDRAKLIPFLVKGVPAGEILPAPSEPLATPVVPLHKPVGEPRSAWERGEEDTAEDRQYPLWAPDRLRKSPKPLRDQPGGHPGENLLLVA
jgi:hypothetical protein